MTTNFSHLIKSIYLQIQEAQPNPSRINVKTHIHTLMHIIRKLLNTCNKDKILDAGRLCTEE